MCSSDLGYFNVDTKNNKLIFSDGMILDEVILQYYNNGDLEDNALMIPILCSEALISYCTMKYIESNSSRSHMNVLDKQIAKKNYQNEFNKAKARLSPIRIDELLQAIRTTPRP